MSKCKLIKLSESSTRRVGLGTVDKNNPKSFFLTVSSWLTPVKNISPKEIRVNLTKKFNRVVNNNKISKDVYLDLDIRESGLKVGKKSFLFCEITFLNNTIEFNSNKMLELTKSLLSDLDNEVITEDENFYFSAKK